MGSIDVMAIEQLEATLELVESELNASDIDARYSDLMASRDAQYHLKKQYSLDLTDLFAAVNNLEEISSTIPKAPQCFNPIDIEKPDEV